MNVWTTAQKKVREVEAWGDSFTPACACGCNEPVPVTLRGKGPGKFVNLAHSQWVHKGGDISKANEALRQDRVPIEKFRAAMRKLKDAKGVSWPKLAEMAGVQYGQMSDLMFGKRRVAVERSTAEAMLRRIAGEKAKPSKWQLRRVEELTEKDKRALRETDPERMPRTPLH